MGKRTGQPTGRPPKPKDEKAITRQVSFTPADWAQIESAAGRGERSGFIARSTHATMRPSESDVGRALIYRTLPKIAEAAGVPYVDAHWAQDRGGWILVIDIRETGRASARIPFDDDTLEDYAADDGPGAEVRRRVAEVIASELQASEKHGLAREASRGRGEVHARV